MPKEKEADKKEEKETEEKIDEAMLDWEEVKPETDFPPTWNGKDSELEEGDTLVGQYVSKKEDVGRHNSNLYIISEGGEEKAVWGSVVLDDRFELIGQGSYVKIVYKGEKKSAGGTYKDYEVYQANS